MTLSPEYLAGIAGIILSVLVQYTPGLREWFDALTPTPKRLVMLGLLALASVGVLLWQCRVDGACYSANWETVLTAFITALVTNQAAAQISPLSPERRTARLKAAEKHMEVATPPKPGV